MFKAFIIILLLLSVIRCDTVAPEEDTEIVRENDKIFIVDRTNKKWDVTHAVEVYNFQAAAFNHGLGPFAIQPINNPEMVSPGETGYPGTNETVQIIGANLFNDTRAYPLNVLTIHEIINETIAGQPLAVAY